MRQKTALLFAISLGYAASYGACGHPEEVGALRRALGPDGGSDGGMPDGGAPMDAVRVPHLINTATGEDYGVLVDLRTLTVAPAASDFVVALGLLRPSNGSPVFYPDPDCRGTPAVWSSPTYDTLLPRLGNVANLIGVNGHYLAPVGSVLRDAVVRSRLVMKGAELNGQTRCENVTTYIEYNSLIYFVDTNLTQRPPDNKLRVELR